MSRDFARGRGPKRADPEGRQPAGGGQADDRPARSGEGAEVRSRGVHRTCAHHVLSALVHGRPGRGRFLVRARDAERGDAAAVRARGAAPDRHVVRLCGADAGRPSLQHVDPGRPRAARSSASTARCICRATASSIPQRAFQHLEKRYFEPGDLGFNVWRTMGGILGMCICNDRRWPETYRVMGLQGVEMIVLGYNTPSVNSQKPERGAGAAHVPAQAFAAGRRLSEFDLGGGGREMRRRGRPSAVRRQHDRRSGRRGCRRGRDARRTSWWSPIAISMRRCSARRPCSISSATGASSTTAASPARPA